MADREITMQELDRRLAKIEEVLESWGVGSADDPLKRIEQLEQKVLALRAEVALARASVPRSL
jgi:hypothetical protein